MGFSFSEWLTDSLADDVHMVRRARALQ